MVRLINHHNIYSTQICTDLSGTNNYQSKPPSCLSAWKQPFLLPVCLMFHGEDRVVRISPFLLRAVGKLSKWAHELKIGASVFRQIILLLLALLKEDFYPKTKDNISQVTKCLKITRWADKALEGLQRLLLQVQRRYKRAIKSVRCGCHSVQYYYYNHEYQCPHTVLIWNQTRI